MNETVSLEQIDAALNQASATGRFVVAKLGLRSIVGTVDENASGWFKLANSGLITMVFKDGVTDIWVH
jgi:hypothetical protein